MNVNGNTESLNAVTAVSNQVDWISSNLELLD